MQVDMMKIVFDIEEVLHKEMQNQANAGQIT